MQVMLLGVLSVISSFTLGIKTAGDVETISRSAAGGITVTGDMNGDGLIDEFDVIKMLEISQGYEEPTADQLLADPNNDGAITVEDAIRILHDIASRS